MARHFSYFSRCLQIQSQTKKNNRMHSRLMLSGSNHYHVLNFDLAGPKVRNGNIKVLSSSFGYRHCWTTSIAVHSANADTILLLHLSTLSRRTKISMSYYMELDKLPFVCCVVQTHAIPVSFVLMHNYFIRSSLPLKWSISRSNLPFPRRWPYFHRATLPSTWSQESVAIAFDFLGDRSISAPPFWCHACILFYRHGR